MSNTVHGSGGDLLVQVLREAGVDTVYGIISVHNLPLVEAVDRELRFVPVRHEATAVNAADGYARATGRPGCALTSTGTGAGNAAGSLVECLSAGTSVLHVTGNIESRYLGSGRGFIHETKDQIGMLKAVSRSAYTITSAEEAAPVLRKALIETVDGVGGPVSVEWPIDLQYRECPDGGDAVDVGLGRTGLAEVSEVDVDRMMEILSQARRPLIWAGGGSTRPGFDTSLLASLIESWGAGLLTSNSGRGVVSEANELCVGNYGNNPGGRALLKSSDLLLTLGTHFRSNETGDYTMPVPRTHIQIDLDPEALGRVYPATLGVRSDVDSVLRALLARVDELSTDPDWPRQVAETRAEVRKSQRAALGDHTALPDAIAAVLDPTSPIPRDVTIASSFWGNRLLPIHDPATNIFPRGGGIGQGLGMALGAADGRPDVPTLCIAGDGGLAVHFGELQTLAQEQPWLVLLLFNDRGYGVLRNLQDAGGGRRQGVDLTTPNYRLVAESHQIPYMCIGSAGMAESVLREAVSRRGPVIVEVDLDVYGPMAKPFTPPVTVPSTKKVN